MKDQFGDTVDLFDFHNDSKPVVVDISAQWCPPCNDLAAWIEGEPNAYYDQFWAAGPAVIARGDIYWITILGEDFEGNPAVKKTATEWYNDYPSPHIPVLADSDGTSITYVQLPWWPTGLLLEADLKVAYYDGSVEGVLMELAARFPE
jgi:thiol-disulfide isomerase/thioredoxin